MATLHPPFSGLTPGKHNLQVSLLGWHTVGSCSITANDDHHFAASGSYDALGHKGTFEIALTLTDKNPDAASGPCIVTNRGQTVTGTYSKDGSTISFSDEDHTIRASADGQNVILQIGGYPKGRIVA
ncbi:MAG: hypothetical protein WBE79_06595 [Candidatus Cybelea sp.]|jgi:hypothetical protein